MAKALAIGLDARCCHFCDARAWTTNGKNATAHPERQTEVHQRYKALDIAPYQGFLQPKLIPVKEGNEIRDVKVEYPSDFLGQMLDYGRNYSYLRARN